MGIRPSFLACVACICVQSAVFAQTPTGSDDIRLGPAFGASAAETQSEKLRFIGREPPPKATLPEFPPGTKVVALASAIGGEINKVIAVNSTGTNRVDNYQRNTAKMPDNTLDAIVLRGLDRVVERRVPDAQRVFMRLNPLLLDDVPVQQREKVALERLLAELSGWPQRQQWDQIIVVTPHYRLSEIRGMASKLHGVGVFVQGLNRESGWGTQESDPDLQVLEPDGTPGKQARKNFVGLYYYAMMTVLDAKTLRVVTQQPWTISEKYYDSNSASLTVDKQFSIDQLAEKLEQFAERASDSALSRTLGGAVDVGPLQAVPRPER